MTVLFINTKSMGRGVKAQYAALEFLRTYGTMTGTAGRWRIPLMVDYIGEPCCTY